VRRVCARRAGKPATGAFAPPIWCKSKADGKRAAIGIVSDALRAGALPLPPIQPVCRHSGGGTQSPDGRNGVARDAFSPFCSNAKGLFQWSSGGKVQKSVPRQTFQKLFWRNFP